MATNIETRLDKLTNAQLAHVYNSVSDRQVNKFSDHTTAVNRTAAALERAGKDFTVDGATVTISDAGQTRESDDRRIVVLVEGNPKTLGSKGHRRFGMIKSGMTVGEFVRATGKEPALGGRRQAIRQLTWDVQHGFIRLD